MIKYVLDKLSKYIVVLSEVPVYILSLDFIDTIITDLYVISRLIIKIQKEFICLRDF